MATVRVEIIDGASGRLTRHGWTIYRIAKVYGLTSTYGIQRMNEAYLALVNYSSAFDPLGIDINFPHPVFTNAFLRSMEPMAEAADCFQFRLTYEEYDFRTAVVEYGGSAGMVETDKDADGNVQEVEYTYPANYAPDTSLRGETVKQRGLIQKLLPEPTLRIARLELISDLELLAKKKAYEGYVNSGPWSRDPTAKEGEWLCTYIGGRSDSYGNITATTPRYYDVTYDFQFRENVSGMPGGGWDEYIRFVDHVTGHTPSEFLVIGTKYDDTGVSTKPVKNYKRIDFNALLL